MTSSNDSNTSELLSKGFGLPETIDPNHQYIYRSGEYGLYHYWYKDNFGNYWLYTNAPVDSDDYDQTAGEAMISPDQPLPSSNPEFFTVDGFKRNQAVPAGAIPKENPKYNPEDPSNIWFEIYQAGDGSPRYVYLDADVRENLDLWAQHQLRVVDSVLTKYRQYANNLFQSNHPKDKVISAILMLVDQGLFTLSDLLIATVDDLKFIDSTVRLFGRKFVCDPAFYDFLTSIVGDRDKAEPLFVLETVYGRNPVGFNHIYSVFEAIRMSPSFLLSWHATQMYSRIVHRLLLQQVPFETMENEAMTELALALDSTEDVSLLVDSHVRISLSEGYSQSISKGINQPTDYFGVSLILSDLTVKKPDEVQFSVWLHGEPMHEASQEDEEQLSQALDEAVSEDDEVPVPGEEEGSPPEKPGEGGIGAQ